MRQDFFSWAGVAVGMLLLSVSTVGYCTEPIKISLLQVFPGVTLGQ